MLRIIRYCKGYVKIKIWGYAPERFINLCGNHRIVLWDLIKYEQYYELKVIVSDLWFMKNLAKKTGVRISILERFGMPFFLKNHKKRKIFLAGFPLCIFFLLSMTRFIWAIDCNGNSEVTNDVLLDFLENHKVTYGTYIPSIDTETLELELRREFPVFTWVSVTIDGTRIYIDVNENDILNTSDLSQEAGDYYDIVSSTDGIITSILTRSGVPMVKVGDTVNAGDILISGSVPIYDNDGNIKSFQYVKADGDIYIQTEYEVAEEMQRYYQYKDYTGEEVSKGFVEIFGKKFTWDIQQVSFPYYDIVKNKKQLQILDHIYLPVYWGKYIYRDYMKVDAIYSMEESERLIYNKFNELIVLLTEKGVQIIEKNVKIQTSDIKIGIYGTLSIILEQSATGEIDTEAMQSLIVIPIIEEQE
ncbi:MAG: sporulation protein YqfD [Eubacteriales bacterium]